MIPKENPALIPATAIRKVALILVMLLPSTHLGILGIYAGHGKEF